MSDTSVWNKKVLKVLPKDLWILICKYLEAIDLLPLRLSCKEMKDFASNQHIWESLLHQERISFSSEDNLITKYISRHHFRLRIFLNAQGM